MDLADQVGWKNIENLCLGPNGKIRSRWKASLRYNDYWLASAQDALYNSSGTAVARLASGRWVGQEWDLSLVYQGAYQIQRGSGYRWLVPGTFLTWTTPGASYRFPYLVCTKSF